MNKGMWFVTLAIVVMGILFTVVAFYNFEPTAPYGTTSSNSQSSSQATTNLTVIGNNGGNAGSSSSSSSSGAQQLPGTISQSQLAAHNSENDCWVGYNGKAYDITAFLPNHPGGVYAIARYCGTSTQFQNAFQAQHGNSKASLFIRVTVYKGDLA